MTGTFHQSESLETRLARFESLLAAHGFTLDSQAASIAGVQSTTTLVGPDTTTTTGTGVGLTGGTAQGGNNNGGDVTLTPGAGHGTGKHGSVKIISLLDFADDAAAATGGIPIGGMYRTASAVMIRVD